MPELPILQNRIDRCQAGELSFYTGNRASLLECIDKSLQSGPQSGPQSGLQSGQLNLSYINPHVFNLARSDDSLMKCLHNSDLLCIDGIGTQIGFSWLNRQWLSRVVAEELFHDFLDTTRTRSKPLHAAMIGIEADSINLAADTIESYTKGLSINYRWHGFEQPDAYKERLAAISGNKPVDLILIGAGSPKSELIAQHALNLTRAPVIWHIGAGTIKTWAGTKRRAPAILSRTGTQWLHRFVFEPHTRSRYLRGGMEFAGNLFHSRTEPLQLSCKSREKNDESTYR